MDAIRNLLRDHLGRSLRALSDFDRLVLAWPLVCGSAMAAQGTLTSFDAGELHVQVSGAPWLRQMMSMKHQIAGELTRIAGVPVAAIHFEGKTRDRG